MVGWIRRHCTFANVVACACLFVVLGGDAVAKDATTAAKKLITGKQVKDRSLTAADVKKGSLTGTEVKDGSLTPADFKGSVAGPKGDPGAKGDAGPKGDKGDPGPVGQIQGAPAGGDLTGAFPNPSIAPAAVTSATIADGTIAPGDLALPWAFSGSFAGPTLSITGDGVGGSDEPLLKSFVDSSTATRPALYGEVNSQFSNFGTAGVQGVSSGNGGFAGLFYANNPTGNSPGVLAIAEGYGNGVTAGAQNSGDGVESTASGSGNAFYGYVPTNGTGRAARLANFNSANTNPAVQVETRSTGPIAVFRSGAPAANVARIDAAGKGFFNGGTQTGGADLAEVVPTCGEDVAPGQVVEIDPGHEDCFRLARGARSALVAGVVSTRPGVTLNAPHGATEDADGPALALAGRVPVEVTTDGGGAIHPGDLLVASATPGRAMRAGADPAVGTVIGKALQSLARGSDTIKMLVLAR